MGVYFLSWRLEHDRRIVSFTVFESSRLPSTVVLTFSPILIRTAQARSYQSTLWQSRIINVQKIHVVGFTPSWMWHFVFGLAAPGVSVKGSRFILKGKAVQEKFKMWRHNPQVHRRENFKFHVHNWSPRSNEHGTRVQCPYGCAHGCRLPIRASVLLNIVLITLRKCNRPSYNQSSWLLPNRFGRIFLKAEREIYAHFQRLLFLMDL